MGAIVTKATEIVKVCKEEMKGHRDRIKAIEKKYHVKFEWDDGMYVKCNKKYYPNEEECYPFDYDEWTDGIPKDKRLYGLNMKYIDSLGKMSKAVEKRCKLSYIDEDEFCQKFVVDNEYEHVYFVGSYSQKDWKQFEVEFMSAER